MTTAAKTEAPQKKTDPAWATATNESASYRAWKYAVLESACGDGLTGDWLRETFSARMPIWFDAGETVAGAVEMIRFTWKASRPAERAEREMDHLKAFVRKAVRS